MFSDLWIGLEGSSDSIWKGNGPPSYDGPTKLYFYDQRRPCGRRIEVLLFLDDAIHNWFFTDYP